LVADHALAHEDRDVLAPVVHGDRVPDHLREDGGCPGPGPDDPLLVGRVHILDPLHQLRINERALLQAATHVLLPAFRVLAALAAPNDVLRALLVLRTSAVPVGGHTPRGDRVTARVALALTTAVRVVDRVHRGTA